MIPKSQAINPIQDLKCLIERIHLKCKFPTKFECDNAHTYFNLVNCYLRVLHCKIQTNCLTQAFQIQCARASHKKFKP